MTGAYLRLVRLDDCALRADTITFWSICHSNLGPWDIVEKWKELGIGHPPFTLIAIKWTIDTFGLPVTHASLRIVPVIFGILCIPVMFLIGRRIGGRGLGVLLAALLALHPVHIQISREPYHYSLLILGSCLALLATLQAFASIRERRTPGATFYMTTALGMIGLTFSTFTGWSIAAVEGLAILGALAWRWRKQNASWKPIAGTVLLLASVALPTLVAPWGLSEFIGKFSGPEKDLAKRVIGESAGQVWQFLGDSAMTFGWGSTPLRATFLLIVAAACALVIWRDRERRVLYAVCAGLVTVNVLVFLATRSAISAFFASRYVCALLPHLIVLWGVGIWGVVWIANPAQGRLEKRFVGAAAGVLIACALGLYAGPAWDSTRMLGQSTPYRSVQAWFNSHLPQNTLVLVDRWFEPWNELRVYNSTNVNFTFTIPNEPMDVFIKYNWRQTAIDFFDRFPDAAYLEFVKSYAGAAGVGPWDWPERFFKRHTVVVDEVGLRLWEIGLVSRNDGRNRTMVQIYYNTREDVVDHARQVGKKYLVLYGPAWGYTKLWQQRPGDFRDWRVMDEDATLDVFNLTGAATNVTLRVRAVAVNGAKHLRASGGQEHTFAAGRIEEWTLGPIALAPGSNTVTLTAATRPDGQRLPLLVEDVTVADGSVADSK
ncbi:MAG: hypothetical protein WCL16_01075 [bacterium]